MKGTNEEKAELIFKIYDVANNTNLTMKNVVTVIQLLQSRRKNFLDVERGIEIFMSEIGIKEENRRSERDFLHLLLSSYRYNEKEPENSDNGRERVRNDVQLKRSIFDNNYDSKIIKLLLYIWFVVRF